LRAGAEDHVGSSAVVHTRFLKCAQRFPVENAHAGTAVHIGLSLKREHTQALPRQQQCRQLAHRPQANDRNVIPVLVTALACHRASHLPRSCGCLKVVVFVTDENIA
jgi:hypothetical protein